MVRADEIDIHPPSTWEDEVGTHRANTGHNDSTTAPDQFEHLIYMTERQTPNPALYFYDFSEPKSMESWNMLSRPQTDMLERKIFEDSTLQSRHEPAVPGSLSSTNKPERMYQYESLREPHNMIRVLILNPSEDPAALVRIQLVPVDLNTKPTYHAMSYVWGAKSDTSCVAHESVNGPAHIQVPANLNVALRHLRHKDQPRNIWADAICIDQSNEQEKGHQVALMSRIFRKASQVVVWLGNEDDHHAPALFRFLEDTKQLFPSMSMLSLSEVIDERIRPQIGGLERFFKLIWFRRLWCLQEIVLARRDVRVTWGTQRIDWDCISGFACWLAIVTPSGFVMHEDAKLGLRNATLMAALRQRRGRRKRCSFLELLALARNFSATDARDKVFALLGISTKDASPKSGSLFLRPDYQQSLHEVYSACAEKIITATGDLSILAYVQHGSIENVESHQSWVPYWDRSFSRPLALMSSGDRQFAAAGQHSTSYISHPLDNGQMVAYGIVHGVVQKVSTIIRRDEASLDAPVLISHIYDKFVNPMRSQCDEAMKLEEICDLVSAGKDHRDLLEPNKYCQFCDFAACMREPRKVDTDSSRCFDRLLEAVEKCQSVIAPDYAAIPEDHHAFYSQYDGHGDDFRQAFVAACTQRRVFSTERGSIGLGPKVMQSGDQVCLLSGVRVPIILRPIDDTYKVVGEAYVSGIMHGEAWNEKDDLRSEESSLERVEDKDKFLKFVLT